jgi:phosphatidylglycerol:prolipoprotein diacylglycerol transferase
MHSALLALLTINVGIDPEIHKFGGLLLTWHGVFTAVGIAIGVYAAVLIGRSRGFLDDDVYGAALIAIPCGIIGARALFVAEHWGEPEVNNWVDALRVNEGGIAIYGAVIGGFIGGAIYGLFRKVNMMRSLDIAACGLILGMAVGRIGDIINGEHFARHSGLPWALRYTNDKSPSFLGHPQCGLGVKSFIPSQVCAQHPAVGYEMLADLIIFALLVLVLLRFRRDGLAFFGMLLTYSLMRFGVTYLRIDSEVVFAGLRVPQVTALCIIPLAFIGLIVTWLRGRTDEKPSYRVPPPQPAPAATGTGARQA